MEEDMVEQNQAADKVDMAEYTFTVYEIDLDYEFDAARFFDFEHAESPLEARRAERWFDSARSYPPSPFVLNLGPGEVSKNINISPKSKGVVSMNLSGSNSDVKGGHETVVVNYGDDEEGKYKITTCTVHIGIQQQFQNRSQNLPSGLTFYNHMENTVKSETQSKPSMKPKFPRASTLMKPTASQLAKQNCPFQACYPRSNIPVLEKPSKSSGTGCVVENQAAKRQKLEGGLLRKVEGTVQLQQINFIHKAPKLDGFLDGNLKTMRSRITIPRDQHLETSRRAQRLRSNNSKDEKETSTVGRFKALPLNRKILEAPSLLPKRSIPHQAAFQQRLHKYTSTFAKNHGNKVPGRYNTLDSARREDASQSSQCFKALPLNKKILTSKGDIGIFRNIKKENTVPMEFNFQTEKRCHNNPPIELFNKLSLASNARVTNIESRTPWSIDKQAKGPKENGWGCFQQESEIIQPAKLKPPLLEGKMQFSGNYFSNKVISCWSKPIR